MLKVIAARMFKRSFPIAMRATALEAAKKIPLVSYGSFQYVTDMGTTYQLNDGAIFVPYRVYLKEPPAAVVNRMTDMEKTVLHCIFSRSCNGFVRDKHIKSLFSKELVDWTIPYIVKVCDEYVIEILQTVYESLQGRNTEDIKQFCFNNQAALRLSYSRMTSYWNAYYRDRYPNFQDYVGWRLFCECFGRL